MSDLKAITSLNASLNPSARTKAGPNAKKPKPIIAFQKQELNIILNIYGHHVAAGEWKDYAIDFGHQIAVFSIFRRASECPVYRVIKDPKLSKKQGLYSVIDQTGRILKRGHDLAQVLKVLTKKPKLSLV